MSELDFDIYILTVHWGSLSYFSIFLEDLETSEGNSREQLSKMYGLMVNVIHSFSTNNPYKKLLKISA